MLDRFASDGKITLGLGNQFPVISQAPHGQTRFNASCGIGVPRFARCRGKGLLFGLRAGTVKRLIGGKCLVLATVPSDDKAEVPVYIVCSCDDIIMRVHKDYSVWG